MPSFYLAYRPSNPLILLGLAGLWAALSTAVFASPPVVSYPMAEEAWTPVPPAGWVPGNTVASRATRACPRAP